MGEFINVRNKESLLKYASENERRRESQNFVKQFTTGWDESSKNVRNDEQATYFNGKYVPSEGMVKNREDHNWNGYEPDGAAAKFGRVTGALGTLLMKQLGL